MPVAEKSAALTLSKGLDILKYVQEHPGRTIAKIASDMDINRSTAHRLVKTLEGHYFIQQTPDGRGYEVGLGVLPPAATQLDHNPVRIASIPYLNTLAQDTGQRVNLGVLLGGDVLYLAGIEKPSLPNVYSRFGKVAPVHCCSLGKAILAMMSADEVGELLQNKTLERYTDNTITDRDALLSDLTATRRRGFAVDEEEHIDGTWCVAAPLMNSRSRPIGAIGISGSDRSTIIDSAEKVSSVAKVISHLLSPNVAL
ncbi:IclR family transcriptional regulator [Oricola indica]|uniref:IclR family transcriptional regulator n=1 Tax=Oricola indica TaxID=2872591 RepID=UPI001CBDD31C|nr:IclR family transcriptional regulator [Oricola indica]